MGSLGSQLPKKPYSIEWLLLAQPTERLLTRKPPLKSYAPAAEIDPKPTLIKTEIPSGYYSELNCAV